MTFRILSITILICSAAFLSIAATPASVSVTSTPAGVYNLRYKTLESGMVKVSIYNDRNKIVFTETLSNVQSFVRPYNLSALPKGEYSIVLEGKSGKHIQKISHAVNAVVSFIRITALEGVANKYAVNVMNNGTEDLTVKIYNGKGLIHEQRVSVTGSFGMVYNLNKVKSTPGATVLFEVSTAGGKVETAIF